MQIKGTCSKCGEYGNVEPYAFASSEKLYKAGTCEKCIKEQEHRLKTEAEKIERRRQEQLDSILAPVKPTLEKNSFGEADKLFFEIQSSDARVLERYEELKYDYVSKDLRDLERKLGEEANYFDTEKARVLSTTAPHILVQARAGSGKTTAIALKVRQLIEFYGARPSEILVLAFNQSAAEEFVERINKYCKANVAVLKENCSTFHSLAHRLINPGAQLLFNEKQDEYVRGRQTEFVAEVLEELRAKDRGVILSLLYNFFRAQAKEKVPAEFPDKESYYLYRRNLEYTTMLGERVKSRGEKYIADFLCEHQITFGGVELEYEYEWAVPSGKYRPDFSLFAKSDKKGPPVAIVEHFGMTTRDKVGRDDTSIGKREKKYLEERSWKIDYCKTNTIPLIETWSDDLRDAAGDERSGFEEVFRQRLQEKGFELKKFPIPEIVEKILNARKNLESLHTQLTSFINRAKKQLVKPEELRKRAELNSALLDDRLRNFMKIACRVYERYQNKLKEDKKIDFDDLLDEARDLIEKTGGTCEIKVMGAQQPIKNIKYILIDEYQDFSELFYRFVQVILKSSPDISLFCVGDDWQAINGFAGSDLKYFSQFKDYFPNNSRVAELLTNHRSRQNIVEHANLLMRGRGIGGKSNKPGGEVYFVKTEYVEWKKGEESKAENESDKKYREAALDLGAGIDISRYLKTVEHIARINSDKKTSLLFRTNKLCGRVDIKKFYKYIHSWVGFPESKVPCSTAHSSKGKESEVVIVVDANEKSFPKVHPDNGLLQLLGVTLFDVLEEERRLFYVAITRAEEKLYLVYDEEIGHSDFISPQAWPYLKIPR